MVRISILHYYSIIDADGWEDGSELTQNLLSILAYYYVSGVRPIVLLLAEKIVNVFVLTSVLTLVFIWFNYNLYLFFF